MQYPFRHKDRTVYANTFLQNVLVEWSYTVQNDSISLKDTNEFLYEKFHLKLATPQVSFPITISSKDNSINLYFGNEAVRLRVRVNAYKGFESLHSFLEFGKDFLALMQINEVQKLIIRKVNMWPYKNLRGNNTAKEVILRKIFSTDLLEGISLPSSEDISQIFWTKNFDNSNDECQEKVNIKFGFLLNNEELPNNLPKDIIVLDTTIERNATIRRDAILDVLSQMNQILFDSYHWCVNQNIIDLMKEDLKHHGRI